VTVPSSGGETAAAIALAAAVAPASQPRSATAAAQYATRRMRQSPTMQRPVAAPALLQLVRGAGRRALQLLCRRTRLLLALRRLCCCRHLSGRERRERRGLEGLAPLRGTGRRDGSRGAPLLRARSHRRVVTRLYACVQFRAT
jgi:hypothetical protein